MKSLELSISLFVLILINNTYEITVPDYEKQRIQYFIGRMQNHVITFKIVGYSQSRTLMRLRLSFRV